MENSSDDEIENHLSSRRDSHIEAGQTRQLERISLESDKVLTRESKEESLPDTSVQMEGNSDAAIATEILLTDSSISSLPLDESAIPLLEVTETVEMLKAKNSQENNRDAPSSDLSASKWQDWFQFTTEQLAKNMKDRSTRAYDAISAITSSGSIRKRKRDPAIKQSGDKSTTAATAQGIGTIHVELISAYKVIFLSFSCPLLLLRLSPSLKTRPTAIISLL